MARRPTSTLAALAVAVVASTGLAPVSAGEPAPIDGDALQQVVVEVEPSRFETRDVTPEARERLEAGDRAATVLTRGTTVGLAMADSVPLIGAPGRWASGYRGEGKVIAIIDTGVDAAFGGTYVGGACFAATEVSFGTFDGHCGPNGDHTRAFDRLCFDVGACDAGDTFDSAAGRPCAQPPSAPGRDCLHGTAVAAVAARHEPTPGVAPGAGIYGIRVFDPTGRAADLVDVYGALEHVRDLAVAGVDIGAVNLSVATTALFSSTCDGSQALNGAIQAFRFIVGELAGRRIPVVVASGNDGRHDQLAFPACLSSTVSVAASDFDDELAPFSNAGPGLDLLAPGAEEASEPRIPLNVPSAPSVPTEWAGTSFAAPHVAGALALVDEEYPQSSIDQRVWLLRAGGVPVRTGTTTRWRVRLRAAADVLNAGVLFPGAAGVAGTPRAAMGDLDGDGRADVLAHAPGSAVDRVSYGRTDWRFDVREHRVAGTYRPLVGSFRGGAAGPDDILWYAPGTAADSLWAGQTNRTFQGSPLVIDGTFQPHLGDFDGDGWDDVFWYAPGPDRDAIWYGGHDGFTSRPVAVRGTYRVAVGDLNGDGRDDIVFHGPDAATDTLWRGTATKGAFASTPLDIVGSVVPLTLDANGDGIDDLFLYAPGSAPDALWLGGTDGFTPVALSVNGLYRPAVGDLDGDGRDDIVWYAPGAAPDSVWFGTTAGGFVGRPIGVTGTYAPLVGDVDGAAGDDVVWFNPAAAWTPVWWSHRP